MGSEAAKMPRNRNKQIRKEILNMKIHIDKNIKHSMEHMP